MTRSLYSGYVFNKRVAVIMEPKEIIGASQEYQAVFIPASISNLDWAKALEQPVTKISKVANKINLRDSILITMIKLLAFTNVLTPIVATATDFGKQGQTFKIEEEPFIQMLKKRLENIDLAKEQKKIQAKAKDRVENPIAVEGINPATKNREFYFDLTYTLDKDAVLPCGKIIHKAGTKVNPLEFMDLGRRLFFIDGREETQVTWLREQLANPILKQAHKEAVEDRVILVGGSIFKLQEEIDESHKDKVYFDQAGELTTKFNIAYVPAIIEQEGKYLKVTEIDIEGAK